MKNQKVVVLGGSQGIGQSVAKLAAAQGAEVVIASSRQTNLDRALAALPKGVTGEVVDLRSGEAVRAMFGRVGPFDHLVYTAGEHLLLSTLADLDFDQARKFFEVRYWGALQAIKSARPMLRSGGSIVLTGGGAGQRPPAGFVIGASICGAMESVTRALALELAPIRVNIVIPGFVDTGLWDNIPEANRKAMFAEAAGKLPVKRIGTPDDIAEHYLSFIRGAYVTGQSITVDGGGALV